MATHHDKDVSNVAQSETSADGVLEWETKAEARVPLQFQGTDVDKSDMNILGKRQVLRRNFKLATMVAFASTVICSWEVLLPFFTFSLTDGGTAGLFWGFIVIAPGLLLVYASLAELASTSPTAGGQYHWVSEFAPPKIQKLLSYTVGWLCAIGWQVWPAGICFMVGTIIQGLIALNHEDYVYERWHGTLLAIAVVLLSVAFNTILATRLPLIEGWILVLHVCGLFAIIIPLWAMAPIARPADVLLTFTDNGGWPTTGLSAMVGLTTPLSISLGYDCAVHMLPGLAEETMNASTALPIAMIWSTGPNFLMAFVMVITLIFTLGDIDSVLNTATGQPFIQVFYNATGSLVATNIMTTIVIIMLFSCSVSEFATASRQLWSFARDKGLPFSNWLSKVSDDRQIPLRSIFVSIIISSLLVCINIGSTTALNAINSLGGVSILTSYLITISTLVWRRVKGPSLPERPWSLGDYGLAVNVAALLFLIPIWFFAFWPLYTPVTASTMNWSSVIFVAVLVVAMMFYVVKGRHQYSGPVVLVKRN